MRPNLENSVKSSILKGKKPFVWYNLSTTKNNTNGGSCLFTDELSDISFAQAFAQIMEMFREEMKDRFDLDETTISEMIDRFIFALRPSTQRQLKAI